MIPAPPALSCIDDILAFAHESDVAMVVTDGEIRTTYVNDAFTRLCGYEREELLGRKPGDLLRGEGTSEASRRRFRNGISDLVPFDVKVENYRKDTGQEYLAGIYVLPVPGGEAPHGRHFVALERELSSPAEDILADPRFSKALMVVVDLVSGFRA